jgi:hypothetical protein
VVTAANWINDELRQVVGLKRLYPFEFVEDLADEAGLMSGCAIVQEERILLSTRLRSRRGVLSTYLHEAGHLVAAKAQIDQAPGANTHNQYFAAIVALMYRRVDLLDALSIYDFADGEHFQNGTRSTAPGQEEEGMADGSELIERFRYAVEKSALLERAGLTVEAAARQIYREDVFPAWTGEPWKAKGAAKPLWWPLAAGATAGLLVGLLMFFAI